MNKLKIQNRLEQMKGKTFQYAEQIHYVESFTIDEENEKVTIKTNIKSFDRKFEAFEEFLSYWTLATTVQALVPIPQDQQLQMYQEKESTLADKLTAILEDNIAKVQTSKDFIPQATSINNNINSIINIQKMKLDFMRSASKRK